VAGVLARPGVEVGLRRATASYTVFHYRFTGPARAGRRPPGGDLEVYERQRLTLARKGVRLSLRTAWGLPEFDGLGYATELAADVLAGLGGRPPRRVLVLNPGQGHLPALCWAALRPGALRLVDRDLLALRVSQANLLANGCPAERLTVRHAAGPEPAEIGDAELVVAVLRPREPPASAAATARALVAGLPRGGRVVLAASSTVVTRCLAALAEAGLPATPRDRRRHRGFSAVVLRRG
jgi:hypothetical protein